MSKPVYGLLAGSFDVIHIGYIYLFEDAKKHCDHLAIALHENPNYERPEKTKPVFSLQVRFRILESIKYVDRIYSYRTEEELLHIIKGYKPDILIIGSDHKDSYTGQELDIPVHWHERDHDWSATKYKQMICEEYCGKS